MNTFSRPDLPLRFEQDLRAFLEDEARHDRPDYLADILVRSAATRQRPAWTIPERWLPMSAAASRVAMPFRVPWRILAVAALLIVLAAAALLVVGSRPHVPSPFGLAANGRIAYATNGSIFTVDPVSGQTAKLTTGTPYDDTPVWSRDGLRLAFVRYEGTITNVRGSPATEADTGRLFVMGADGSGLKEVTTAGMANPRWVTFSPDGREIAFVEGSDTSPKLYTANADGSGVRLLVSAYGGELPLWRPPDGAEIIYAGPSGNGLYAVNAQTGATRTILDPKAGIGRGAAVVSPDGSRIAYSQWSLAVTDGNSYVVHVVNADGSGDRPLPMAPGVTFQDRPEWSNDGTKLAIIRGYDKWNQDVVVAIIPADGSGTGIETKHKLTGCCDNQMIWAPSDSAVLFLPDSNNGGDGSQILINPTTGATTTVSWGATSYPAWQRLAP